MQIEDHVGLRLRLLVWRRRRPLGDDGGRNRDRDGDVTALEPGTQFNLARLLLCKAGPPFSPCLYSQQKEQVVVTAGLLEPVLAGGVRRGDARGAAAAAEDARRLRRRP